MNCLNPPLPGKPKKGFGFTCAPCYIKQEEEYEEYLEGKRSSPPPTGKQTGKGKGKETDAARPTSSKPNQMRLYNGWPWRYFGAYTIPDDVLDPHESLYPRAASVRRLSLLYLTT